jgi:hypothetical protein
MPAPAAVFVLQIAWFTSPGMPREMALPTAIGDATTAVLALLAFVALHREHRLGLALGTCRRSTCR